MRYCLFALIVLFQLSCWTKKPPIEPSYPGYHKVYGWKPVYGSDTAYKKLNFFANSRPLVEAGKIYVYGNTIYQNDIGRGIHIIDNSIPAQAHRTGFLELAGNTEMAVKANFMYANNYNDLVVIDISNPSAPVEVKRLKNMFELYNNSKPYPWQQPSLSGYYECPQFYQDSVVISWVRDSVHAYCYKP